MADQLVLIDVESLATVEAGPDASGTNGVAHPWRLDAATVRVGRRGVAQAREALRAAQAGSVPGDGLRTAA